VIVIKKHQSLSLLFLLLSKRRKKQ